MLVSRLVAAYWGALEEVRVHASRLLWWMVAVVLGGVLVLLVPPAYTIGTIAGILLVVVGSIGIWWEIAGRPTSLGRRIRLLLGGALLASLIIGIASVLVWVVTLAMAAFFAGAGGGSSLVRAVIYVGVGVNLVVAAYLGLSFILLVPLAMEGAAQTVSDLVRDVWRTSRARFGSILTVALPFLVGGAVMLMLPVRIGSWLNGPTGALTGAFLIVPLLALWLPWSYALLRTILASSN